MTTTTQSRWKKKMALALLLPVALLLSACKVDWEIGVSNEGHTGMVLTFTDDTGMILTPDTTCEEALASAGSQAGMGTNTSGMTIKETTLDGQRACQMTATSGMGMFGQEGITDNGDSITLEIPKDDTVTDQDLAMVDLMITDFTFTLTFPGDVIEAPGAQINGNTATWTKFSDLAKGIKATGKKSGSGNEIPSRNGGAMDLDGDTTPPPVDETTAPADETTAPADETTAPADETTAPAEQTTEPSNDRTTDAASDNKKDDEGGSKLWMWIAIGAAAVAALGGGAFALTRKKKGGDDAAAYSGYGQAPYGQAPYGQAPQQGYQPNQPTQAYQAPQQYGPAAPQQPYGQQAPYGQQPPAAPYGQQPTQQIPPQGEIPPFGQQPPTQG